MASADLGGLGANDSPPVPYKWSPPSLLPVFLPWLGILGLLLLKFNRTGQAWWIWAPLACVVAIALALPQVISSFIGSAQVDVIGQVVSALAFGLAVVWLLIPRLRCAHRGLTFIALLFTWAIGAAVAHLLREQWVIALIGMLIAISICSFCLGLALWLAGLVCRRRYLPSRLTLALLGWVLLGWALLFVPAFAVAAMTSNSNPPWTEFSEMFAFMVGLSFTIVLPFLILSFANAFYRERLIKLLHLEPTAAPPLPVPPAPPVIASTGMETQAP